MSLGKLFNLKYLKQNIKKSKGPLTILIFIIPVITALILIGINSSDYPTYTGQGTIAVANILGMYVIPIIISYLLYGYVYKKNSVDFVNSMPLTRSTIFTTNFIGGFILILIIQILTAIVTAILTLILSNVYISMFMILDIFVVMLIAYTFVFSATCIAMTISGNFLTQIVATLLIVFLIPFISIYGTIEINKTIDLSIEDNIVTLDKQVKNNYTFPSIFLRDYVIDNTNFYNMNRDVKTVILITLYFGIGLYLFNKRKMENVEVSFSKTWVHLLVKSITLVPMVFFLELIEPEAVFYGIGVVLIFIYYCLYDFITHKKVLFRFTILSFIIAFLIIIGLYKGVNFVGEKIAKSNISVNDIKSISLYSSDYLGISDYFNEELGLDIDDEELINEICQSILAKEQRYNYEYNYSLDLKWVYLKITLKNGRTLYANTSIYSNIYTKIFDYAKGKGESLNKYDSYYNIGKNPYIIANNRFLSKENIEDIKQIYNNIQNKLEIEKDFSLAKYNSIPAPQFEAYVYRNHRLVQITINPFLSQELFDKMNQIVSEQLKEKLEKTEDYRYIDLYIQEKRINKYPDNNMDYINFINDKDFIKYIKDHIGEKIDINNSFYVFSISGSSINYMNFYLNETEELNSLIEKNKSNVNYDVRLFEK